MKAKLAIVNITSSVFIFLFTYTAISKILSFTKFELTLSRSPLINGYSKWIAIGLPPIELIVSALLLFPKTNVVGLYCSFVLMSIFSIYIGYMLLFESHLPCSCGGVLQQLTWQQHLGLNLFFTAMAATTIMLQRKLHQQELKLLLQ